MKVNVELNGVNVPAEMNDAEVRRIVNEKSVEIKETAIREMINELILETVAYQGNELDEEEFEELLERIDFDYHTPDLDRIITKELFEDIQRETESIIENRTKWFEVEITYRGSVTLAVKAKSEEQARDYIERWDIDIMDYIDLDNADFDVDHVVEEDEDNIYADGKIDLTE